jgi:Na+-driven multidrug efflux pump
LNKNPWPVFFSVFLHLALGEAFTGAVAAFVSQNLGARRFERISAGMRFSHMAMLAFVGVTIAAMLPFMRGLLCLYIDGADPNAPQAMAAGLRQLRLILLFLPAHYIVILHRAALRGLGDGLAPLLSGFIEALARVGCLALLPVFLGGEWSAYLAEVIGWPFMLVFLHVAHRRLNRRLAAQDAAS